MQKKKREIWVIRCGDLFLSFFSILCHVCAQYVTRVISRRASAFREINAIFINFWTIQLPCPLQIPRKKFRVDYNRTTGFRKRSLASFLLQRMQSLNLAYTYTGSLPSFPLIRDPRDIPSWFYGRLANLFTLPHTRSRLPRRKSSQLLSPSR